MGIRPSSRIAVDAVTQWLARDPIGENGGLNLYAYVGNDPINLIDPTGQYASPWHYGFAFTASLIAGENIRDAYVIAASDVLTDALPHSQSVQNANWHSMRMPGQSIEDAQAKAEERIEQLVANGSDWSLGQALHTNEDAYARGHNFKEYHGLSDVGIVHEVGDWFPTAAEIYEAIKTDVQILKSRKKECKK